MKSKKVAISILVLCGVLGELCSRYLLGLGDPPLSIAHPTIEYMFKPNQKVNRFGNEIVINQYGMRSTDFSPQKKNNEYRVLVIGDSVVYGGNLTDQQHLATEIVREKLQAISGKNITVGNISAGSWGPGNWLAYVREYAFFDADEIVLVISSHDYADNPQFTPLPSNSHPQRKPFLAVQEGFTRYFLPLIAKNISTGNSTNDFQSKEGNYNITHNIQRGLDDLKKFLLLAQNTKAKISVIQYWSKPEVERSKLDDGHEEIKEVVEQLNIPVTQTGTKFQQASKKESELFRDWIHPTEQGQKLLAESIMEVLSLRNETNQLTKLR